MMKSTSQMEIGENYEIIVQGVIKKMQIVSKEFDDDGNLIVRSIEVLN
jgi:hypothetical protein